MKQIIESNPQAFEDILADYFACKGFLVPGRVMDQLRRRLFEAEESFVEIPAVQYGTTLLVGTRKLALPVRELLLWTERSGQIQTAVIEPQLLV